MQSQQVSPTPADIAPTEPAPTEVSSGDPHTTSTSSDTISQSTGQEPLPIPLEDLMIKGRDLPETASVSDHLAIRQSESVTMPAFFVAGLGVLAEAISGNIYLSSCEQLHTTVQAEKSVNQLHSAAIRAGHRSIIVPPAGGKTVGIIGAADGKQMGTVWVVSGPAVCTYTILGSFGNQTKEYVVDLAHKVLARASNGPVPTPSARTTDKPSTPRPTSTPHPTAAPKPTSTPTPVVISEDIYGSIFSSFVNTTAQFYLDVADRFAISPDSRGQYWETNLMQHASAIEEMRIRMIEPGTPITLPPNEAFADMYQRYIAALGVHHSAYEQYQSDGNLDAYRTGFFESLGLLGPLMNDLLDYLGY